MLTFFWIILSLANQNLAPFQLAAISISTPQSAAILISCHPKQQPSQSAGDLSVYQKKNLKLLPQKKTLSKTIFSKFLPKIAP